MADLMSNWMGGPRHAPRAEFAAPELARRNPVASFSNPAGATQEFVGTGSVTNAAGRGNRKRSGGAMATEAAPLPAGPLSGLADAQDEIISASGLGQKSYHRSGVSAEDAMNASDADPARPATTGNPADPDNDHPLMANLWDRRPQPDFFTE